MGNLLDILDFVVLLLIVVLALRTVWNKQTSGSGSLALSICTLVVAAIFAIVSYSAYMGIVEVSSSMTRGFFLVVLLILAALLRISWSDKSVA